jgi:uncharacterized protein YdiU (UPF0061 family)
MALRFRRRFWSPEDGVVTIPTPVDAPRLLAWNEPLADALGISADERSDDAVIAAFAGNAVDVIGAVEPMALVYAGHQFGHVVPRLGDGRAILLGEVCDVDGEHFDVQLKGSGPTPYSRGGDGRAAIGPALREFLLSEAMHTLGVKTTQALVVTATGEPVYREQTLPGAVVTRVARSHLRVGTFAYWAMRGDVSALRRLVAHAVDRHHHSATDSEDQALGLLDAVVDAQAQLVAQWMAVGFVHGVMNTDNCSIAGETIDYGPAAFLDAYDPERTFSSIDRQGRYAYGRQPEMAMWNVMRLGDCLVPVLARSQADADVAAAQRDVEHIVGRFPQAYAFARRQAFLEKLGVDGLQRANGAAADDDDDDDLIESLLMLMAATAADFTATFRALIDVVDGVPAEVALAPALPSSASPSAVAALFAWARRYRERIVTQVGAGAPLRRVTSAMRGRNPARIPRNHVVEAALVAATAGDLEPFRRLRLALQNPYSDDDKGNNTIADVVRALIAVPGEEQRAYRTFCGT